MDVTQTASATSPKAEYLAGRDRASDELATLNRRYNILAWSRLLVFAAGVAVTYFAFPFGFGIGIAVGGASLLGFLYLLKAHSEVAERRELQQRLVKIHDWEVSALEGDFSHFQDGREFVDPSHAYSYDLDLFGKSSMFQYLNRTGTMIGRMKLAEWLQKPQLDPAEIVNRQEAVVDLSQEPAWSLKFQALGMGQMESLEETQTILDWVDSPTFYSQHPWIPKARLMMPILFALTTVFWLLGSSATVVDLMGGFQFPGWVPGAIFLLNLTLVGQFIQTTNSQQNLIGQKSRLMGKFASMLGQIETRNFESKRMKDYQEDLKATGQTASDAIHQLSEWTYQLDQRLNMIAGILLNGVMLWDFHWMMKLEGWRTEYRSHVHEWTRIIAETDALMSFGRYRYNRPDLTFPIVENGAFHMDAEALGHPLIDPTSRIDNDVTFGKPGEFLVVTGANMAGKSTFLRTVGVNLIVAMAGGPVVAGKFTFAPVDMITSIRTTDSLSDHESYFYAELKQLKKIIDKLDAEGTAFVIVDEMLRGTNSRDKQTGSWRFIERLISKQAVGMVATHDLALGKLMDEYPGQVFNKRFEVDITDGKLTFDYKLRDGISQNLNATFLMEQMGIM
ncbi:MutS-related protein [Pontibacter sp. G13]|uniref:MutS-related protein n=1 Tax=Pontibacter sp. G13 TaxID=3074898 RepID=UPI00288B940A|nr:hypothetical protein [Pontibacter sp. G13]WNJ20895.1 hypothetical protein RJD25_10485 [Pontibacter sp. G13]